MPLRHERETPSGPIKLNVGQIRVLVDANIIVKTNPSSFALHEEFSETSFYLSSSDSGLSA